MDMTATDVFNFDVHLARIRYLQTKRELGVVIDAPAQVRAMWDAPAFDPFDPTLPATLRRQAD